MLFWVLFCVFLKHFLCDFPFQTEYMLENKGTYGHPGGIFHAGIHALGTFAICLLFSLPYGWIALVDGILHYHTDWAKANLTTWYGVTPNDKLFWNLLGLDQLLHMLTYLVLLRVAGIL